MEGNKITVTFPSHWGDRLLLPDAASVKSCIDYTQVFPEQMPVDLRAQPQLTHELIQNFYQAALHTLGAPSTHEDLVIANMMQPLGVASQVLVGTNRLRIPEQPKSMKARSFAPTAFSRLDRASNAVSTHTNTTPCSHE